MASNAGEKQTDGGRRAMEMQMEGEPGRGEQIAPGTGPGGEATPPAVRAAGPEAAVKPRADSTVCPKCLKKECPAIGGSRKSEFSIVQYRVCQACGHRFKTTVLLDGEGNQVGPPHVSG
jgi:hypothetical protein